MKDLRPKNRMEEFLNLLQFITEMKGEKLDKLRLAGPIL